MQRQLVNTTMQPSFRNAAALAFSLAMLVAAIVAAGVVTIWIHASLCGFDEIDS